MAKKKSKLRWLIEYLAVVVLFTLAGLLPNWGIRILSRVLGDMLFTLVPKRRNIAINNISSAFPEKTQEDAAAIAKESCRSFIMSFLEMIKTHSSFKTAEAFRKTHRSTSHVEGLFKKAKDLHDSHGGCIFLTPHIGNWELLPHVSALVGINLVVVARPLDNPYLEKLLYSRRTETGQMFIAKTNAMFKLQETLRRGKSIGMLPDQSTSKGISVDYFGRKATATPIPAMLSVMYKKPIVVCACVRQKDGEFTGFVCDPILPLSSFGSEKGEIHRITGEITKAMELIIREYPEQYLWIHNRWKTYKKENVWAV
ncbi:lysophospholipid acyltransferase family protein [Candidatus Magnetomonas plexicatena]|uniref:lysophospholipid acyltransferase family protein n=1 Tax=Candidatus Magnetomonas plexicatena TaxID=2552947 RepID=UPI001C76E653|nr:lysophospholipid acyltransferase family protein [Nitrospirales bacterium LBB_01]